MKKHTAIYYHAGAYGTFIEWCLNYFSDKNFHSDLPFTAIGNSHLFHGNLILSEKMFSEVNQNPYRFFRTHPGCSNSTNKKLLNTPKKPIECYRNELKLLQDISDNVIVLYFNDHNILWGINNIVKSFSQLDDFMKEYYTSNQYFDFNRDDCKTLTQRIKLDLTLSGETHYKQWSRNSWEEMDDWQLREFLSLYLEKHWFDLYTSLVKIKDEFPNIIFIELGSLRDNFKDTISMICDKLNLTLQRTNFEYVYNAWFSKQTFINRDEEVNKIVHATISDVKYHWQKLTIIDEAIIQKKLRDNGINLKCFDLNVFPQNSQQLKKQFE